MMDVNSQQNFQSMMENQMKIYFEKPNSRMQNLTLSDRRDGFTTTTFADFSRPYLPGDFQNFFAAD
jgi:hypothetical protein